MPKLSRDNQLAYDAGRAAITEPPERRGVDACPFPGGTPERKYWLQGLSEAMQDQPDPAEIQRALKEADSG